MTIKNFLIYRAILKTLWFMRIKNCTFVNYATDMQSNDKQLNSHIKSSTNTAALEKFAHQTIGISLSFWINNNKVPC